MRIRDHIPLAATLATMYLISFAFLCRAEEPASTNADYVAGESSQVLVTPELRAMASQMFGANAEALLHAVALQMGKYDLDMAKADGRRAWHGRLIREEILTNDLCKVEVYSNELTGATWRFRCPFSPKPMVTTGKRRTTYTTNGIPARLAAARARRAAQLDGEVQTVTVEINANQSTGNSAGSNKE